MISIPSMLVESFAERGGVVAVGALGGAYLLGAVTLWIFPMALAHRLLPKTSHTNFLRFPAFDLARGGCSLLGLWLIANNFPTLIWLLLRSFLFSGMGSVFSSMELQTQLDVSVAFCEALFAVFLLVKSELFACWVCHMQTPSDTAPEKP